MASDKLDKLTRSYIEDPESVYHTWFLNNEDRLKAFRTIKKGLRKVITEIEKGTFGNDFKGSSLETVVTAISEQKQIFEGAAHPFFWKPKLRIPDIYENPENQLAFGRFLSACLHASNAKQVFDEIVKLDQLKIKGLGPAVANILYFLHPTCFPPFNTAIVRGFNALFHKKLKLGSWIAYLEMREDILVANQQADLSKDLGAFAGLLFEIGSGRLTLTENAEAVLDIENEKRLKALKKRHHQVLDDQIEENSHSQMQYHLARLGRSLGYRVWIAQNDHKREYNGQKLGEYSLPVLPLANLSKSVFDTVALIDVLWLNQKDQIVSGFEVEKSTSIYSGILRLYDLSLSVDQLCRLFLVAPDKREKEIKAQLMRPSFVKEHALKSAMTYLLFSDLQCDCDAMCKFGKDISVLDPIARSV
ncbi:hypothetical protein M3N64_13705 [Sporolactobacillus sp. CPB3-1]|uniref:Type II restriction endonuclease n=1 Tax=Sporolactobacillus mangiferae TaxID=2940498 RepID=A0ABT0MDL8_9BACL|nr:hypothetical protein [Sporolactobacillus mangiferae]MCL1632976.1 hypothetical protein [Sporolactobacillus mangiferae]